MTTYTITTSNWNSSGFWSSVSETGSGHVLDFSGLPSNFYVTVDSFSGFIDISDGSTTFRIKDASYSGPRDAQLGGSTEFDQFSIVGGQGWNDFYGDTTDDTFTGAGDDDYAEGGSGNDSLSGEGGSDTLYGGSGDDTIRGGAGNDTIQGNQGNDSLDGGSGDDVFQATDGSGFDTVDGGTGTDTIQFFGPSSVTVDFTTITSGSYTYAGNVAGGSFQSLEAFEGTTSNDTLNFSAMGSGVTVTFATIEAGTVSSGADTITFTEFEQVILTGNADYIDASALATGMSLDGGAGSDTLVGSSAADTLAGGDGADTFVVSDGSGNDTIIGGEGGADADVIDLSALSGPVTVTYTGDEAGTITNGSDTITFSQIERLILTDHADVVDASADTAGIDVDAGLGNDTITGGTGGDTVAGGAGSDSIETGAGNDQIAGGADADTIRYGFGDDTVFGGDGDDWIDDSSTSTTGSNEVYGGDGNDTVYGGTGADTLSGGTGNDYVHADAGDDSVTGGAGNDTILGHTGSDTIDAGSGDDSVNAGDQNDTITGGTGDDTLTGGDGNDTFVYASGDGHDTITDFNFGNSGALHDGDATNNDFIDLSEFYDHLRELRADQADDGILNQSNAFDDQGNAVDYSNNSQFGAGSITMQGASASSYSQDNTGVDCFTAGTLIRTPAGHAPIEALNIGDLVVTLDNGPQPIRWIGVRKLGSAELTAHPNLRPVLIQPGALGNPWPILVSPQHGVLLEDDHLVRATHLARNIKGARIAHGKRTITYIHLLFDAHQIIFANGIMAESFYPGPQGLHMMPLSAREEMMTLFPDFLRPRMTLGFIRRSYGLTARTYLKGADLQDRLLTRGLAATSNPFH